MSSFALRYAASRPRLKLPTEPNWKAVHRAADAQRAQVRRAVLAAATVGQRALDFGVFSQTLANRSTDQGAIERAAEYASGLMRVPLERGLEAAVKRALIAAGEAESQLLYRSETLRAAAKEPKPKTRGVFNVTNPEVVVWIREHVAEAVGGIMEATKAAIRLALEQSFQRGITTAETARTIRRLIGLDEARADAVWNLRDRILESPGMKVWAGNVPIRVPPAGFTEDALNARLDRYAVKLLNDRAENIARTETITAANEGQSSAWVQAVRDRLLYPDMVERVWIVTPDDRLCPICADLEGATAPIGGEFQSPDLGPLPGPPAHPQCRCAQGLQRKGQSRTAMAGPHKYATTQVDVPGLLRGRIVGIGRAIADAWLAEQGRETSPHVTVLYGLADGYGIAEAVSGFGPASFDLGRVTSFDGVEEGTADALVIEVRSDCLRRLRDALLELPHKEQTHEYRPHITIAYVKPGLGQDLASKLDGMLDGESVTVTSLTFNNKFGGQRRFPLTGQRVAGEGEGHPFHGNQWTTVFHGTPRENLERILTDGLAPSASAERGFGATTAAAVFVTTNMNEAKLYAVDHREVQNGVILEIHVPPDVVLEQGRGSILTTKDAIPPSWIKAVYARLDSKGRAVTQHTQKSGVWKKIRTLEGVGAQYIVVDLGEDTRVAGDYEGHTFHGNQWTVASTLFEATRAIEAAGSQAEALRVRAWVEDGIAATAAMRLQSFERGTLPGPVRQFPGRHEVWRAFQDAHTPEDVAAITDRLVRGLNLIVRERHAGDVAGHEFHGNQWTGGQGTVTLNVKEGTSQKTIDAVRRGIDQMPAAMLDASGNVKVTVTDGQLTGPGLQADENVGDHRRDGTDSSVRITGAKLNFLAPPGVLQYALNVRDPETIAQIARHELGHAYDTAKGNEINVASALMRDDAYARGADREFYGHFLFSSREAVAETIAHITGPTKDAERFKSVFSNTYDVVKSTLEKRGHL